MIWKKVQTTVVLIDRKTYDEQLLLHIAFSEIRLTSDPRFLRLRLLKRRSSRFPHPHPLLPPTIRSKLQTPLRHGSLDLLLRQPPRYPIRVRSLFFLPLLL